MAFKPFRILSHGKKDKNTSCGFISRVERGRIPEIQTIDKVHSYINGSTKAVKPFKGEK
jgi:hypothetical protein